MTIFIALLLGFISAKMRPQGKFFPWIEHLSIGILLFCFGINAAGSLQAGAQVSWIEVLLLFVGITFFACLLPALFTFFTRQFHE